MLQKIPSLCSLDFLPMGWFCDVCVFMSTLDGHIEGLVHFVPWNFFSIISNQVTTVCGIIASLICIPSKCPWKLTERSISFQMHAPCLFLWLAQLITQNVFQKKKKQPLSLWLGACEALDNLALACSPDGPHAYTLLFSSLDGKVRVRI